MTDITAELTTALADRYRIEGQLGEGGMATVYLAHDLKHDRKVAIKVLKPELAAVIGGDRFLKEIRVTANLQHPRILGLYDSGTAGAFPYYVMPYVKGESLRQLLERKKQLSVEEAIRITEQVGSALAYAHRQGVIHRDIKPENILLHEGEATVADFGIALALTAAGGQRLTETGLSLGTPQYMSPEQATGERQLDAASDIYSLACMLYEMLAGEPPHTGATTQAIIAKLLTERPAPVRSARETVSPEIDAAVMKALSKVAADRFETADDFVAALRVERLPASAETVPMAAPVPSIPTEFSAISRPETIGIGVTAALLMTTMLVTYPFGEPPRIDAPTITTAEALETGRAFLTEHGAAGRLTESLKFDRDSDGRELLLKAFDRQEAREWALDRAPVSRFEIRWFRAPDNLQWIVHIGPGGRVILFRNTLDADAPGAAHERDPALVIAESFLVERGWDKDSLRLTEAREQQQANRTDHHFTWELVGQPFVWDAEDSTATPGSVRVHVDVFGDGVTGYNHYVQVPAAFSRSIATDNSIAFGLAFFIVIVLAIVAGVLAIRHGKRPGMWVMPIATAIVGALGFALSGLSDWRSTLAGLSASQSIASSVGDALFITLLLGTIGAGLFVMLAAGGEFAARREIPDSLIGFDSSLRRVLPTPGALSRMYIGYLVGLLLVAGGYLGDLLDPSGEGLQAANYLGYLDDYVPFLTVWGVGIGATLVGGWTVLTAMAVLKRYTRSTWLSVTIFAGWVLIISLPDMRAGDFVGLAAVAGFAVIAMTVVRYGLLATMCALYCLLMLPGALGLLSAPQAGMMGQGIMLVLLLVAPLGVAHFAASRTPATS